MRTATEIIRLLDALDRQTADSPEGQDLDFKLMRELRVEVPEIKIVGRKKGSRYVYASTAGA